MNRGFFVNKDKKIDLTLVPGKEELLKPKAPPKTYDCQDCGRCAHALIKVRDYDNDILAEYDENGKQTQKEKLAYKLVEKGGEEAVGLYGEGLKKILIVTDEVTEGAVLAKKPIIGQELKLLRKSLKEVGLDLERDCWLIPSVRGNSSDKKSLGVATKACGVKLRETIEELQPSVIIPCGYRSVASLLSHKVTVTTSWDIYESYTIPDQEFKAWVIPTWNPRDFIYELSNRRKKFEGWAKEKLKKGERLSKWYQQAIDKNIPLVENPVLRSDDFKVKFDRFIRALKSATEHYNKEVPIDNAPELVEVLFEKQEVLEAIYGFHNSKVVSVDVECSSLKFQRPEADILCIGLGDLRNRNVAFMTKDSDIINALKELLSSDKVQFVAHNAPYELSAFKSRWDIWMENIYIDSQLLAHAYDHRAQTSGLKTCTYTWFGSTGAYGDKCKPFFKPRDEDMGTIYEKSNQAINKLPEALERGKLYEQGLLFPLEGDTPEITKENTRREKLLKKGYLTETELLTYNCLDIIYTAKLVNAIVPKLMNKRELDAVKFSTEGAICLAKVTYNGVQTNQETLKNNIAELEGEINELHTQIINSEEAQAWDGGEKYIKLLKDNPEKAKEKGKPEFNYNSGAQLGRLLFKILKYPAGKKTATGGFATDKAALEKVGSPICKLILQKKTLEKAKGTYLEGWQRESDEQGVVKCNFPLGLTLSWRSSSRNCNFQNSPKHSKRLSKLTRSFIEPFKGQIWKEYDFSAAENYCASIISGDLELLRYNSDSSTDLHGDTAVDIFRIEDRENLPSYTVDGKIIEAPQGMWKRLRQTGKLFVFPAFFGSNYIGITDSIWEAILNFTQEEQEWLSAHLESKGIHSKDDFLQVVKEAEYQFWQVRFKDYYKYKQDIWKLYVEQGYLQTPVGHVLRSVHNRRTASSYSIQGGSFEKLLCGMIKAQKTFEKLGLKSKLVGEVHDSLCVSVEKSEEEIVDKIVTTCLIDATKDHPLFDWINLDFVLDCDSYVEGNWATKPIEKRMDIEAYRRDYVTF